MTPPPNLLPALPSPRPRKSSAIRIILFSVLLAVIGVLIIPGYYVEERIRGKMAWEKYAAEAGQRGVKLDFADFIPPKIPDNENFASIPIFDAAFQAMEKDKPVPNPFKKPAVKGVEHPPLSDANKQTLIDLAEWQKYFVKTGQLPAAGDNAAKDILRVLTAFDAPLAQLHEAETRPHCRFPVHWEKGLAANLGHYEVIQSAAQIEALRLSAHLALGDSPAAYEDFHHGFGLATAFREEPVTISGLVRVNIAVTLGNAVWSGLARHQWGEPELRKIEADVSAVDWLKDFEFAMSSERAVTNQIFDTLIGHPQQMVTLLHNEDPGGKKWSWILWGYPSGWIYQSKLRMNRFFDEILARTDAGQHRWFGERPIPSSATNLKEQGESFHYFAFRLMAPVLETVENNCIHMAVLADESRLACVLERFHLVHGQYPGTLTELVPEYIPTLPADLANGAPYHYHLTPKGRFLLYSVGPNQRDDFGVINPKLRAREQLDWVWCYPVK
ncbi:MAG TPA: hypothetical protein VK961_12280 [Chthoniobacter sp.]|nr:hypothetical protein [Chthoniobacter sp.]